jgi:chromosome segregation ATPase
VVGMHGLVIDVLEIPKELVLACDIALQRKAFNFVVDSFQTA